jgi:hypothetical protein
VISAFCRCGSLKAGNVHCFLKITDLFLIYAYNLVMSSLLLNESLYVFFYYKFDFIW